MDWMVAINLAATPSSARTCQNGGSALSFAACPNLGEIHNLLSYTKRAGQLQLGAAEVMEQ